MPKLVAMLPVLYRSRQYGAGDALPADDSLMVSAWLEAGSAKWIDETHESAPKARLAAAEPGKPGKSSDGDPNAMVGKRQKVRR